MRKLLLYSALATLSLISACKKDEQSITAIRKMDDLVIPQGFDWSTTKAITFNVSVSDSRAGSSPQKLAIYEANPADGASPIATGFVSPALPYSEKIFFSSAVKQVYIVKTSSDGSSVTQVAGVRNAVVAVDFSEDKVSNASGKRGILSSTLSETFCDCSSADQITSDFSRDLSARDAGKTYCITKDGVSFEFNNNADGVSVIIKVCARNVKFDGKLINNSKIIITKGASVVMGGRFNIGGNASFVNYGTVVVPSGFSLEKGKEFLNYGSLTIGGDLNLNEVSAPVVNYEHAKLRIKGKLMINTGSSLLNYGKANFQNVQVNSSGVLENYCSLYVQETLSSDAVIKNSSFINVGYVLNENDSTKHDEGEGKTGFNSRGGVNFTGGGLFQTKVLGTMDGRVTGAGQESLFLTERFTGPMNSGKFLGAVVYYAKREAQYLRSERFANGARETKKDDITINASDCNPGYGLPSYTYTTSVNYYNGGSTLIFEDKWPIKGDFDLNDVVVLYKYIITKNSENKAIKIDATYSLIASGGSNRSGFGIEFPVSSDKAVLSAKNKSSIIYEANQEKAVVVLFNDARNLQRTWNTLPNEAHSDSVTFSFTLTFKEPVTLLNDAFNPFIFAKGTSGEKRSEVHLPYKNGTSLANPVLREGDNSATDWYVTKDRLPWALNIPLASFRYPLERTSISLAYPDITSWAQTGGKEEEMWYNRPVLDKCYIVK